MIRVKAKRFGYFNHVKVKEGQEFFLNSELEFSHAWMESLDKEMPSAKELLARRKKAEKKEKTEPVKKVEKKVERPADKPKGSVTETEVI